MAQVPESLAEVTVRGGAFAAGGRGERPARQALVTEVDPGSDPSDPAGLARVAARRRAGHNGGSDLGLPKRGATLGEAPSELAVFSYWGRRAATFSGSRISRSVGSHSGTAQMTSRRIVVGVPAHNADILPADSSSPASAHLGGLPDTALGGLQPQIPLHELSLLLRNGIPGADWRPSMPARRGHHGRAYIQMSWPATDGPKAPARP